MSDWDAEVLKNPCSNCRFNGGDRWCQSYGGPIGGKTAYWTCYQRPDPSDRYHDDGWAY